MKTVTQGGTNIATYNYDDLGRRTSITRGNGVTTSYGYDAQSRLTDLGQDLAGTGNDQALDFTYNPAGQIIEQENSNTVYNTVMTALDETFTANGLNQLLDGTTITYDGRGNMTNDGSTSYTYDVFNRLTDVGTTVDLKYDPAGRLFEVDAAATLTVARASSMVSHQANEPVTQLPGERAYGRGIQHLRHGAAPLYLWRGAGRGSVLV
nr:RHS repeat domain-containing protein [Aquisalinus flavus]